jgi:hypothetical protein
MACSWSRKRRSKMITRKRKGQSGQANHRLRHNNVRCSHRHLRRSSVRRRRHHRLRRSNVRCNRHHRLRRSNVRCNRHHRLRRSSVRCRRHHRLRHNSVRCSRRHLRRSSVRGNRHHRLHHSNVRCNRHRRLRRSNVRCNRHHLRHSNDRCSRHHRLRRSNVRCNRHHLRHSNDRCSRHPYSSKFSLPHKVRRPLRSRSLRQAYRSKVNAAPAVPPGNHLVRFRHSSRLDSPPLPPPRCNHRLRRLGPLRHKRNARSCRLRRRITRAGSMTCAAPDVRYARATVS